MRSISIKHLVSVAAVAVAASASFSANAASFGSVNPHDSTSQVTHASLMKELQELRAAGYDLQDNNFPESLQRAQRKLDAQQAAKAAIAR